MEYSPLISKSNHVVYPSNTPTSSSKPSAPPYTDVELVVSPAETVYAINTVPTPSSRGSRGGRALPIPHWTEESTIVGWQESGNTDYNLKRSQIAGEIFANNEVRNVASAHYVGKEASIDVERNIMASNRKELDFNAAPQAIAVPIEEQNQDQEEISKSQYSQHSSNRGGYQINDYKSMYESNNNKESGYKMSDYKSMYDS